MKAWRRHMAKIDARRRKRRNNHGALTRRERRKVTLAYRANHKWQAAWRNNGKYAVISL